MDIYLAAMSLKRKRLSDPKLGRKWSAPMSWGPNPRREIGPCWAMQS